LANRPESGSSTRTIRTSIRSVSKS
jgi:hypothetical protein